MKRTQQLNLFGDPDRRPEPLTPPTDSPRFREQHRLAPYFDALAALCGRAAVNQARGRVGKMAKDMEAAGLTVDRLREELPAVVRRYAPRFRVIDLTVVACCWPWILDPPRTVGPSPAADAVAAVRNNGGEAPF